VRKGVEREVLTLLEREAAVVDGFHNVAVLLRGGHNCHGRMVLRRGADHRGAADVDLLDALIIVRAGSDGLLERVEVDHHQLERLNPQLLQLGDMAVLAQVCQDAGVHARVERLHTAVEDLREPGQLRHLSHGNASISDALGGGAGGDDFHACLAQRTGQILQPGLVVHTDEGALDVPLRLS